MLQNYMFALMGGSVTDLVCCVCVVFVFYCVLSPDDLFPPLSDCNPGNQEM